MGENAIADLIDYLTSNGAPDNMKESECQLILRALRLLAAAEANDGSTPETDAYYRTRNVPECEAFSGRLERERNGLAARVGELEQYAPLDIPRILRKGKD